MLVIKPPFVFINIVIWTVQRQNGNKSFSIFIANFFIDSIVKKKKKNHETY